MSYKSIIKTAACLMLTACSGASSAQDMGDVRDNNISGCNLYTPSPSVPKSTEIFGTRIALDRNDLYERFDRELTTCTYTHGTTLLTLKRANRYFPVIIPILKKNGIPTDMIYLAVIESNLDERALSPAKAGGIWQFMPATARQYGLEVNDFVDERYNLEKATEAACRYLKEAYSKYGDWLSVAAAYNAGQTRISKEMESQGENSALDLYLVTETSRYPFRLMAMKTIMENPSNYGFSLRRDQLYQPIHYDEVTVNRPIEDLTVWAKDHGISYMQLHDANPWIRAKTLPNKTGKNYKIKIPRKTSLYRSTQEKSVYNPAWIKK